MPLQAYFRINARTWSQFERTLIIVDEGAYVHYVEGCTAPIYTTDSGLPRPSSRSSSSLVGAAGTRRSRTGRTTSTTSHEARGRLREDDHGVGGREPRLEADDEVLAIWLMGEGAHGEVLSIAFAGDGQHRDAGGKAVHVAPNTTSVITSKSISKDGGRSSYRGLLEVAKGAHGARSKVVCDALILDEESRTDTYPYIRIDENDVDIGHEATVSKIGEEQLFYLMSRGLSEAEAAR